MRPSRFPNFPHGITGFGVGAASTAMYNSRKNHEEMKNSQEQVESKVDRVNDGVKGQVTTVGEQVTQVNDQVNVLVEQVENVTTELHEARKELAETKVELAGAKTELAETKALVGGLEDRLEKVVEIVKKTGSNLSSLSTSDVYDSFIDLYNKFYYMDELTQMYLLNTMISIFLGSLLFSYLLGVYGNYLINRFKLIDKYPKLKTILELRSRYLYFYRYYLLILAIFGILDSLFINITGLI